VRPKERRNFRWSTNYNYLKIKDFSKKLNSTNRRAWKAFENVCRNFLGTEKAENYIEIVQEIILTYSSTGCH
jgi:hypothetical protein